MTAIIAFFTTTALGRALAQIGALVLAVVTFGMWNRRKGAQQAKADRAAADAKAKDKTINEVLNETVSHDPADAIRKRLRDRAGKP